MSDVPTDCRYTKTHEWVKLDDDGNFIIGITQFAQEALGDLVFVELPELEMTVSPGDEVGVLESVKAASDVYSPVSGEVNAVNDKLSENPELVNQDPHGDGWIFRVTPSDSQEWEDLLDAQSYNDFVEAQMH